MSATTPNLGLIVWSGSDQYSTSDLANNWNVLDEALGNALSKGDADTISATTTITGTLQFGATSTIPFTQVTVTTTPSNYKAVKIGGSIFLTKAASGDTVFGVKLDGDSEADASFRFKMKADGGAYWGNGTAQDVRVYRDSAGTSLLFQTGSDVDTANPTGVLLSPDKDKSLTGPSLSRTNLVWNPDFEMNNDGWSVAALSSVVAATTSIVRTAIAGSGQGTVAGNWMGVITTPGSAANEGAHFRIYRKFQAGTQYNIKARVYSGATTTNVQIGMGASGIVYASSTAQALSSTWSEITLSWTPVSTVDEAYFFVRLPGTVATTFAVDEVRVYTGSAPTFSLLSAPVAETFPRWAVEVANISLTSSTQYLFAVPVEKGMIANRVSILAGDTAASGITLAEAGLYSVTLDTTNGPGTKFTTTRLASSPTLDKFIYQGPYAPITWDFATPYRFTYTGVAYIGAVITAGVMPTLSGRTTSAKMLFAQRAYHWYPLVAKHTVTGALPSSGTITDLAAAENATNDSLAYAWIS